MSGSIHAILEQNDGGDIYVSSLLKGGQLAKKVRPLDRLEAIDSHNCNRMPLVAARRLISGLEGSPVTLTFTRRGMPGRIVTTVVRTSSELSDLQVSLLEDVLALIKQERNPAADGGHDMYDVAKRGSWRSPNSYEGALFNEVVDGVRSIRSGVPTSPAGTGAGSATARARTELEAANRVAEALRREMLDRDRADVCAVTVTIKGGEGAMQEKSERQHLQTSLLNDVSRALGVMPKRLEVVGMHRADARGQLSGGDYDLDLFVLPCAVDAPPTEAPARKIAEHVVFQASNPGSPLRELPIGSRMTRGEHRSTYEYVHRLRHTVRILQEEVSNIEGDAEKVKAREARIAELEFSLQEARREIQRLEESVEALRRARPAPAVATNPPRDDAMLKDKLREVEGLFAEAQNVIVRLEKERGTSMSELSRLRQVLDSTAADRASVEEEVAKLRARVALSQQAGSDGMDPRHRLKELEDALRVARHDLGESIKENTQLKARLATSPGTEDTHFGPLREALGRAERAEGHLASLRDALEDATTKLGSLPAIEGENRRLAQALAAQQEAKVQQDLEIARHRDTITGQQQQIAVLTREVDRLRMEKGAPYVTRSGDVAAPRANNGAADEDLRLALRNAKAEVERLRADVSDLARRLDQAEGAKRSALADAAAHKETAEAQKHIAAQAVKDHKELATRMDELGARVRELESKNSALDARARDADVQRQSVQAELQKVNAQKDAAIVKLQQDVEAQKVYISQLQKTIEEIQVDAQAHRGEAQRMRQLVDGIEVEKKLLRDEIRDHRERLDKYSELHSLDARQKAQKDEVIAAKDREIERLRDGFKTATGPAAPPVVPPPQPASTGGHTMSNPISSLLKSHT